MSDSSDRPQAPRATLAQLEAQVAVYRTALVTLLDFARRQDKTYRTWEDQMLIRSVQQLLDDEARS